MRTRERIENITDLEILAQTVEFPPASSSFHRYKARLSQLLAAECGDQIALTLTYDDEQQLFYVTVTAVNHPLGTSTAAYDGFDCTLSERCWIEPKRNLMDQFEGIKAMRTHLRHRSELISHLLNKAMEEMAPVTLPCRPV